jgi:hypothetical protein
VDYVNRFRTAAADQKQVSASALKEGKVDILIGTHRSGEQGRGMYKDLGLLIVDEEQKFGVSREGQVEAPCARRRGHAHAHRHAHPAHAASFSLMGARDLSASSARRRPTASRVSTDVAGVR